MMKQLMVANWKMNKTSHEVTDFFFYFNKQYSGQREAWVAPQALHLMDAQQLGFKKGIKVGAQNCSAYLEGAHTGEISPQSLKDARMSFVILGHSERRQHHGETSRDLNKKVRTVLREGLTAIYCVGETLQEREAGQTLSIIGDQLEQGLADLSSLANAETLVVAYEPVWAIGTGKTASPAQAQEVHAFIRQKLCTKFPDFGDKLRILYGGSVKPENVEELLSQKDINGGLVGGASLKPKDFLALCGDK
jgi:triosephosphate isomerase (TIM)